MSGFKLSIDPRLVWLCVALVGVDLGFLAIHAGNRLYFQLSGSGPWLGPSWIIGRGWSYPEMFGCVKVLLMLLILLSIPRVWKRPIYLVFAAILALVLVDQTATLHHKLGSILADTLGLQALGGLEPQDSGELLAWTLTGFPSLLVAGVALAKSSPDDRRAGLLLLTGIGVLGVFAVGMDAVHSALKQAFWKADGFFNLVEEGGEQLTLSVMLVLVLLLRRALHDRQSLTCGRGLRPGGGSMKEGQA